MVVFDATILIPLLWSDCPPPRHPETKEPVNDFKAKIEQLITDLDAHRTKIIIPTPALSEVLVRSPPESRGEYLHHFTSSRVFMPVPFDERAALELAIIMSDSQRIGEKRDRDNETIAKFKFDRQIVAIARVEGASTIYTDDRKMISLCRRLHMNAITISELPSPPADDQLTLEGWAREQKVQKDANEYPEG